MEKQPPKKDAAHQGYISREERICALLLKGCDKSQIARQIGIAERNIKVYLNTLYRKLGGRPPTRKEIRRYLQHRRRERATKVLLQRRKDSVIQQVSKGRTNAEIAKLLGMTENCVKTDLRNIYNELGLWNRVELAMWYIARKEKGTDSDRQDKQIHTLSYGGESRTQNP